MVCGGDVDISFTYVDADEKQWQEMAEGCRAMEAAGESVWLLIGLNGIHEGEAAVYGKKTGQIGWKIPETVIEEMRTAFGTVEADGTTYYYERLHSSGKVYIFGGGHVAQAFGSDSDIGRLFLCDIGESGGVLPTGIISRSRGRAHDRKLASGRLCIDR